MGELSPKSITSDDFLTRDDFLWSDFVYLVYFLGMVIMGRSGRLDMNEGVGMVSFSSKKFVIEPTLDRGCSLINEYLEFVNFEFFRSGFFGSKLKSMIPSLSKEILRLSDSLVSYIILFLDFYFRSLKGIFLLVNELLVELRNDLPNSSKEIYYLLVVFSKGKIELDDLVMNCYSLLSYDFAYLLKFTFKSFFIYFNFIYFKKIKI